MSRTPTPTTITKATDTEYEDTIIEAVTDHEDGYSITTQDGWSFWVPKGGPIPHVGSRARFYGRGIGYVVRGLDIDGQEVYYRTPAEENAHQEREWGEYLAQKRRDFEAKRTVLDAQYDALPSAFRRRLDRFRSNHPDFRWQHEAYELFVCEAAVRIADHFKDPAAIDTFAKLSYEEQQREIPGIGDDHSGNTWGCAVHLARIFVQMADGVTLEHGALCPLVGCRDYGCVPTQERATP